MTRDAELVLEDGDVRVLYSDGVTETRDAHLDQYGLARICAALEAGHAAPVDAIRDRILEEVEGWCPSPDDHISIVVARSRAPVQRGALRGRSAGGAGQPIASSGGVDRAQPVRW